MINYAFVMDTETKQIIAKARGNGIELIAELPFICALTLKLNAESPGRYYATIAAASIFRTGRIGQSSLELYGMMWVEAKGDEV